MAHSWGVSDGIPASLKGCSFRENRFYFYDVHIQNILSYIHVHTHTSAYTLYLQTCVCVSMNFRKGVF